MTELHLVDGEPAAGPWVATKLADLVAGLPPAAGRPTLVGVDGRSASGKSTLADRLVAEVVGAVVVHTDDLAWWEPMFEWGHLLLDDVLGPLRAGHDVSFTPPAWSQRGRPGSIDVPASAPLVLIEGVGAGQEGVRELLDALIWVQSDFGQAERRGLERDIAAGTNGDEAASIEFWHEWMAHERKFLAADRPWERADWVVAGSSVIPLRDDEVALATGRGRTTN